MRAFEAPPPSRGSLLPILAYSRARWIAFLCKRMTTENTAELVAKPCGHQSATPRGKVRQPREPSLKISVIFDRDPHRSQSLLAFACHWSPSDCTIFQRERIFTEIERLNSSKFSNRGRSQNSSRSVPFAQKMLDPSQNSVRSRRVSNDLERSFIGFEFPDRR